MNNQNKVIICSGDSFTEGSELGAELLIPGYTELLWLADQANICQERFTKLGYLVYQARWNDHKLYEKYISECKQRAWPAHLEKLSGIATINVGAGAISNQEIAYRALDEFFKIHAEDPNKEITVFLMLTSPSRLGAPKQIEFPFEYAFRSYMPGYLSKLPREEKQYVEYAYKHYTDDDLIWESYSSIKSCVSLLTELGVKVYILDTALWRMFLHTGKITKKWISMTKSLDIKIDFSTIHTSSGSLSGRHYTEARHIVLAQKLLEFL